MSGWFGKIGTFLVGCVGMFFGLMFVRMGLLLTIFAGTPHSLSLRGVIDLAFEADPFFYWPVAIFLTSCIVCIRSIQNWKDARR